MKSESTKSKISKKQFDKIYEEAITGLMVPIAGLSEKLPGHPFNQMEREEQGEFLYSVASHFLDIYLGDSETTSSPKEILDYKIVSASDYLELENSVKELIDQGWQPTGGVSFSNNADNYQAMVMYEE